LDIIGVIVWVIMIVGVAALCWWGTTYVGAPFQRPLRIVIIIVAAILLVYLVGAMLLKLVPPFPGLILPKGL
jgi:hypothetical protein